jgi:hypothetical protein
VSDRDRSELATYRQLEQLVRHLLDELASFRRRALQAEARVKALEAATAPGNLFTEQRVLELEREVTDLRARLGFATDRTRAVLEQVKFLRQQQVNGAQRPAER